MKKKLLNKQQRRELRSLIKHSSQSTEKERIRAQILLLFHGGLVVEDIMEVSGYQRRRLFQIRQAYLAEGLGG